MIVAVQGLPSGTSLANAYGVSSEGIPFEATVAHGQLAPGKSTSVILTFAGPDPANVPFGYRLLIPPTHQVDALGVAGLDAHNDGIRDDVDAALVSRYQSTGRPELLAAGRQFARALTGLMLDHATPEQAFAPATSYNRSVDCLAQFYGDEGAIAEALSLQRLIVNTRERNQAIIEASDVLAGQVGVTGTTDPCTK